MTLELRLILIIKLIPGGWRQDEETQCWSPILMAQHLISHPVWKPLYCGVEVTKLVGTLSAINQANWLVHAGI